MRMKKVILKGRRYKRPCRRYRRIQRGHGRKLKAFGQLAKKD